MARGGRKNVITVEFMRYRRSTPKTPYLGWATEATRKLTTIHRSPGIVAYKACVAREMTAAREAKPNKKFANLMEVQKTFQEVAAKCKEEVRAKLGKK